jgi:plasmid stability protein
MPTNKTYVRIDAYVTPETKEALRVKAFQERRPVTEIVREMLEKALKAEKLRGGKDA